MKTKNATQKPASTTKATQPPALSTMLIPGDFRADVKERWCLTELADEAQSIAHQITISGFTTELEHVFEFASICDVAILTKAIQHWRNDNLDSAQPGSLLASILFTLGVTELTPGKTEPHIRMSAMWAASKRLTEAGVSFVDDTPSARSMQ